MDDGDGDGDGDDDAAGDADEEKWRCRRWWLGLVHKIYHEFASEAKSEYIYALRLGA